MLTAVCHAGGSDWEKVEDLSHMSNLRAEGKLLWADADVAELGAEDIALIAEEFGLHPLAVEDAQHTRQRPKLDKFDSHLFVVMHQLDEFDGQLEASQTACFMGDHYVLTLHTGAQRTLDEARKRWSKIDSKLKNEPSALLYTFLDTIIDDYQVIANELEEQVEQLEEITLELLEEPDHRKTTRAASVPMQRQLYSLKQRLARLRRYALPSARILDVLTDPYPEKQVSDEVLPLLRDVQDHILRIRDQIRNVDELAEAILELRRAEQATSLNEVTKKLTGWAAIIAVPTLISGIYGMNFALVPAEGEIFGFWLAIALIAISVTTLYVFFKRRGWI